MSARGKHYNTPYAKPVHHYSSQSKDYISFDISSSSGEKTPGYNGKYQHQNYRNSNSKRNRRNLFNNSYGQQNNRQNYNQQERYGPRNGNEGLQFQHKNNHQKVKNDSPISTYYHPSMTEDPWCDLMQRIKSLDNSKISITKMSTSKDSTSPSDSKSNSESDNEEVDSSPSD